ncbi:MAG TPA: CaiB/BaiF CoA-transferase family protein [Actinopolymorphaceae bacterium]
MTDPTGASAAAAGSGPLTGVRVLELAGLAPGPFAATLLSDLGAEVVRIDRPPPPATEGEPPSDPLGRGRRSVSLDLKHADGPATLLRLATKADVLLEGFRPGVCERLGIGPDRCLAANPRLVYARLTGYGQDGPWAGHAGHDIDYLALSGALAAIGPATTPPVPPVNFLADFGGGGMLAVVGVLAALFERERSGRGQVVDAAMTEGVALFTTFVRGLRATGAWSGPRGTNVLDGGAPFYRTYACADGRFVAVGAIEPEFYAVLVERLGLTDLPPQWDRAAWGDVAERFAAVFASRPRDAWAELFDDPQACVAPVLELDEAPDHPQARTRRAYVDVGGQRLPAPAPRLSRTPGAIQGPPPTPGRDTARVLSDWGFTTSEITRLRCGGALG